MAALSAHLMTVETHWGSAAPVSTEACPGFRRHGAGHLSFTIEP